MIADVVPPGTTVILRGSAVTGCRWKDQAPFDADGPGTSDLDVTFVGSGGLQVFPCERVLRAQRPFHARSATKIRTSRPTSCPLRRQLMDMVKRPVNLQASRDIVLSFRGDLLGQPYLTLFIKPEGLSLTDPALPA